MSQPIHRRPHGLFAVTMTVVLLAWLLLFTPGAAYAQEKDSPGVPPGKAWVRVGHFVPGMKAGPVELTPLEGSARPVALGSAATYGSVSAYQKLVPGSYTATVRDASAADGAAPLLSRSFEIVAGEARTIAVLGSSEDPRLGLLVDDLTPPAPGTARVRLLAASEEADSITVEAVNGPTVAEGAVLGQTTPYATVPAGSWTLQSLTSTAGAATLQDVKIASGSVYTVVALDAAAGGVELRVVTDAAGAVVAPKGGAKTGDGGAAVAQVSSSAVADAPQTLWAALLSLTVAGLAWGAVRRRRGAPVVEGRP